MPDDSPSFSRPYICLEEADLADVVEDALEGLDFPGSTNMERELDRISKHIEGVKIMVKLGTFVARNTDDAKRQAGKSLPITGEASVLQIVAVPERNFQPSPVNVNPNNEVSLG